VKVDGMFGAGPVMESTESIVARAQQLEEFGYDGLQIAEVAHDPFLPLVLAAHHTSRIELRTSIAVAFEGDHASGPGKGTGIERQDFG